jgi:hypothetical protein
MKAVLKPEGIIRSNLHSSIQRFHYFRAQKAFTMMGLMDENPEDLEMEIVVEIMNALKDGVKLKASTWDSNYEGEGGKERILMNYLFQGDKGYTITDMFDGFRKANLEFISMVNWREWDLVSLFKEPDNLPAFMAMSLPECSIEEQLQLFELMHPIHRLLDFWCGHPQQEQSFLPVEEWKDSDWQQAKVHLHPQLKTSKFREDLIDCVTQLRTFFISNHLSLIEKSVSIDSSMALCLVPLLEQPQSMMSLVERWKQVRPLDPITLEATDESQAFYIVQQLLLRLESLGYLMLEP